MGGYLILGTLIIVVALLLYYNYKHDDVNDISTDENLIADEPIKILMNGKNGSSNGNGHAHLVDGTSGEILNIAKPVQETPIVEDDANQESDEVMDEPVAGTIAPKEEPKEETKEIELQEEKIKKEREV